MTPGKIQTAFLNRFQSRRARLLVVLGAVAVLILLVPIVIAILGPSDSRIPKVTAAVRTTFPTLCRNAAVAVTAGAQPDSFDVRCDPNPVYLSKDTSLLTVNITTCQLMPNPGSLTLMTDYPELFNTKALANCPLQ